jgi:hypothetical protein
MVAAPVLGKACGPVMNPSSDIAMVKKTRDIFSFLSTGSRCVTSDAVYWDETSAVVDVAHEDDEPRGMKSTPAADNRDPAVDLWASGLGRI